MTARRPRIGLLGLTLELYETLSPGVRTGREQWVRRAVIPALKPLADISFGRAVNTAAGVEAAVRKFEADGVDALLVMCLTYAPSQIAVNALARTRLPLIVWNTQELRAVDDAFGGAEMIANHGVHGTQDLCNVLLRNNVRFSYVTSHIEDADGVAALAQLFTAVAAATALRGLRVGLLGHAFPGMGDCAFDSTLLAGSLGCQWVHLVVEQYIKRAAAAPAAAVRNLVAGYRAEYAVRADVTDEDLEATARAELSLRQLVRMNKLGAVTYQFMAFGDDERTETVPFVAASRLMGEGIGFAGEADIIGAIGTWLLNRVAPPASFSEIFTIDFAGNGLFMSHMGEANTAIARPDRQIALVARPKPITRTRKRQLALVPEVQPGRATLCAFTIGPSSRWRIIAGAVNIPEFVPRPSLPVPQFKIAPAAGDVRDWLTRYALAGGPHHNAVCFGDARPVLRALADVLGADYREV
ncbi:hypothetical protein GX586_04435 [bacterium]|nr:hypothetical protein [bacterium]